MLRICFLCCLFVAVEGATFGQRFSYSLYGQREGLKSLTVRSIEQDRAGYVWVGTQNGLYRFDGNRFVPFELSGLPNSSINGIFEDRNAVLWVASTDGISRGQSNGFQSTNSGLNLKTIGPQPLAISKDDWIYAGTKGGLFRARIDAPLPVNWQPVRLKLFGEAAIRSVMIDSTGKIWMTTLDDN